MIPARRRPTAVLCAGAAVAALALPAVAAPPGGDGASPAKVLELVDSKLGKNYVSLPERTAIAEGADKTLAPFLYVAGGDPDTERLPLKSVSAEVQIAGVIARVRIRQVFENGGKKPIEATYLFPASTRAAVHGMRMKIGARTVEAKIERRQVARAEYEAARREGRRASLLEQQRPNVFTMDVANLMPGDRIETELDYSELLVPDSAIYEFVFPTVVGPRYGGHADNAGGKGNAEGDKWIANPYMPEGAAEPFPFDIKVHLESGIALKEISSPSHPVHVKYTSQSSADIALDRAGGGAAGNRDFVLRYRLAGDRIETGMLLMPGERENFFITLIEPPQRPTVEQIVPREYIFVLDVSGSMYGFPLETAKTLMRNLLGSLRPTDWFNVVLFAGTSFTMSPHGSVPATPANIASAVGLVDSQRGGGGTELLDALRAAYGVPRTGGDDRSLSRNVVVITDGYVGVEAQSFKYIREHLDEANLFAFGIGSSVNRALIEGMARAGQGEPFVVLRPEKAREQADRLRAYVEAPVLTNIRAEFDGFAAYDVAPAATKIPDLMARRPIVLFGKYKGAAHGTLRIRGSAAGSEFVKELDVASASARPENSPLRFLWARKWVETLDDERAMVPGDERLEQAITRIGLDYTLLTAFTSFVAADSEVVNHGGRHERVNQPLPLPEGVSNNAVGRGGGGVAQGTIVLDHLGIVGKASGGSSAGMGHGAGYGRGFSAPTPAAAPPPPSPAAAPKPMALYRSAGPQRQEARRSKAPAPHAHPLALGSAASTTTRASAGGIAGADERRADAAEEKAERPLRTMTISRSIHHVGDAGPAMLKIEEAVKAALGAGAGVTVGSLAVKVTLDAQGKVLRLEISGADPKVAAEIRRRLVGLTLASRALGAPEGTVEVTFSLSR